MSLPTIKKILDEECFGKVRSRPSQENPEVDSTDELNERVGKIERSIDLFQNGMKKERASPKYLLHEVQSWAPGYRDSK